MFLGAPPARGTYWSNGTTYARRLTRDDGRVYNTFDPVGSAGTWQYWTQTVPFGGRRADPTSAYARVFGSVPVRVLTTREPDGVRRHLLVGDRAAPPTEPALAGADVRNVSLAASVTDRGVVRSFDLRYRATVDGDPVRVTWRVTYEAVGRTEVSRPAWLEQALRGERDPRSDEPATETARATPAPTQLRTSGASPA